MTLGGGLYGPALKTEHTEKEWLGERLGWKLNQLRNMLYVLDIYHIETSIPSNFYEAEWKEELDNEYKKWMVEDHIPFLIVKHNLNRSLAENED